MLLLRILRLIAAILLFKPLEVPKTAPGTGTTALRSVKTLARTPFRDSRMVGYFRLGTARLLTRQAKFAAARFWVKT